MALGDQKLFGRFEDLSIGDPIRNDGLRPADELAVELAPFLGQRPIAPRIASLDPCVILKGCSRKGCSRSIGVRPTRSAGIPQYDIADDSRMDSVLAIELNIAPIDEYIIGIFLGNFPPRSPSQGVGIKYHPLASSGDPSGPRIESNRDPFVSDIQRIAGNLIAMREHVSIVHRAPCFDFAWLGTSGIPTRQLA